RCNAHCSDLDAESGSASAIVYPEFRRARDCLRPNSTTDRIGGEIFPVARILSAKSTASAQRSARRRMSTVLVCIVIASSEPSGSFDAATLNRSAALERYARADGSATSSAAHAAQRTCSAALALAPSRSSSRARLRKRPIKPLDWSLEFSDLYVSVV